MPVEKIPGKTDARVLVAYKPVETIHQGSALSKTYGWVRMVVWLPTHGNPKAHVNISTNSLDELLKARLQGFKDGSSLYLVDYVKAEAGGIPAKDAYQTRKGDDPWDGNVSPPAVLVDEDSKLKSVRPK